MSYTLTDFFDEYMFRGRLSPTQTVFSLDIFEYNQKTGLFVASGNEAGILSAIVGKITPDTEAQANIKFRQIPAPEYERMEKQIIYRGHIIKTKNDVQLKARRDESHYSLELIVCLKGGGLVYPGWMDNAVRVELPKK